MSTFVGGLRLAVGTFTRIPSGEVTITPTTARAALLLAPIAVLPVVVLAGLVAASVEDWVPPYVAAGLALMVLAYGTRGMHLDGLTDTVDGLGAGPDRERALRVMRSGDVGPMGVAALVLVLLVQAAALAHLITSGWPGAVTFMAVVLASRTVAALTCTHGTTTIPDSRLGAPFVGSVPPFAAGVLVVGGAVVTSAAGVLTGTAPPILAFLSVVFGALAAVMLRRRVAAVLGGINGDTIGAAIEVAFTVILVTLSVAW